MNVLRKLINKIFMPNLLKLCFLIYWSHVVDLKIIHKFIFSSSFCFRERFGGIKPPVLRSELDFDPGSKYHVPANIPYMR